MFIIACVRRARGGRRRGIQHNPPLREQRYDASTSDGEHALRSPPRLVCLSKLKGIHKRRAKATSPSVAHGKTEALRIS